ncbi:Peptidase S9B dipeptidylpeptidase IV domain protein [Flavobacterium sp. 9R]|uniref:S9 family peptidase n=1 Tax=Flavobacterium sp. 9R TaxID=2653143 RepID=UPI0012F465A0|nr:S9 family peptidase [Flavobacterium sp. 9R]VXB93752.1 Peptidase S9B dipeptidylpeptidase IV domain protein [Flavobacterium sp. 9R]
MTKKSLLFVVAMLMTFSVQAQNSNKTLTETDYEQAVKYLGFNTNKLVFNSNVNPNWLANGDFWYNNTTLKGKEIVVIHTVDGTRKTGSDLKSLLPENNTPTTPTYTVTPFEVKSPDGKKAAFIKDWNLWVKDLASQKETQLTFDGVKDYGYATDNAGWKHSNKAILLWSPDSKKIATFQQDQRHVKDMYLVSTNVGAPKLEAWKYPLPGDEKIIQIERVIIEVETPKVIRFNMAPDPRRGTLCDDISCSGSFDDNEWNADGTKLAFVSTSRDHKEAKVRIANALTGAVKDIFEEKVATQYESGQGKVNWHYLESSNEIIWYSERDDWGHLYLYDAKTGKLKSQITKGNFVVTQLLKVDEKNRILYFKANGRETGRNPYFSHFYRIDFSGKNLQLLTPEDGNHTISLSPNGDYFVDTYSQPNVAPVSVLRAATGKLIATLEKADISKLVATGWKAPEPIKVKSRDGKWDLYGLLFTPTHLDATKKYPVVNYIYPGPQGGGVGSRNFFSARSDHQALAELGFVVVIIDGTCNPDRSKSFHDACYGNMADNTLEDQISGMKQLATKYPFMDLDKVGIWGHSGGGYATAAALFRYPEFYKVGISESGNHENRNYEDDWGERYIGLLTKDANGKSNYEDQANANFATNLKGKLLLAHGGMDDNVPPYNTYLVIQALQKANKDFDFILFPNARHGFGGDTFYMMRKRWDYFVTHLLQAQPPKEFLIQPK